MDPNELAGAVVTGLLIGGVYGVAGVGLSIVWGVLRIVNFAQADFMMLAMFASYWSFTLVGVHPLIALPVVVIGGFAVGVLAERLLFRAILNVPEMSHLLYTAGLGLILQNVTLALWQSNPRSVFIDLSAQAFQVAEVFLNKAHVVSFILSLVAVALLVRFFLRSRLGTLIRATVDDRELAALLGVDISRIYAVAFGLSIAATALAGGLIVMYQPVSPTVGTTFIVLMFVVVVLGGMGNIGGTFVGGLVIGVIQTVSARFAPVIFQNLIVFAVFMLLLLFRPRGLFGTGRL